MPTSQATINHLPGGIGAGRLSRYKGVSRGDCDAIALCAAPTSLEQGYSAHGRYGHRNGCHAGSPVRACSRQSGFTLMELLIVMTVLVIAAAAIMPNVVAYEKSQQAKALEASIIRFPVEAKNEAVKSQMPVRLRIESDTLVMERVPLDATGEQQPESVKQLSLGTDAQVENTQLASTTSNDASWQWTTYPDGSSDAGGIQFSIGSVEKSLVLPANGSPQWVNGPLPDQTSQKWQAGQLATRQ